MTRRECTLPARQKYGGPPARFGSSAASQEIGGERAERRVKERRVYTREQGKEKEKDDRDARQSTGKRETDAEGGKRMERRKRKRKTRRKRRRRRKRTRRRKSRAPPS